MIVGSIIVISLMLYSLFSSRGTGCEKYVLFQSIILLSFIAGYLYTIFSDILLITLEQTFNLNNLGEVIREIQDIMPGALTPWLTLVPLIYQVIWSIYLELEKLFKVILVF